jgi:hypothetical protein
MIGNPTHKLNVERVRSMMVHVDVLGVEWMVHRWGSYQNMGTIDRAYNTWQPILVVEPVGIKG